MAFQTIQDFNQKKYNNWFVLLNDQDSADVVFLYEKQDDALMASVHYIKSLDYSGYVHCAGAGCPACAKGLRIQTKFFIPLYNITAGEVQYWDRSDMFTPQFQKEVFQPYPNPSEFVFRVIRHGRYRDRDTRYQIMAVGKNNTVAPMAEIMAKHNLKFPESYNEICKEVSIPEMQAMLDSQPQQQGGFQSAYGNNSYGGYNQNSSYGGNSYGGGYGNQQQYGGDSMPNYQVTPRSASSGFTAPASSPIPNPAPSPMVAPPNEVIPDPIGDEDDVEF